MRIDKYLWSVRYFKTRSMATAAARKGQIRINDTIVKPARDVYPGDTITLRKNQINYIIEVLDTPKSRVGAKLVDIYRKDKTPTEAFEASNLANLARDQYRKKGLGRPTKKDRRDIEGWLHDEEE